MKYEKNKGERMQHMSSNKAQDVGDAALYDHFASTILTYLYQQVSSLQDAEDLLLEVFLAAQGNSILSNLSPERQLAWLRRVARNKVIDHYRRNALLTVLPLEQVPEREDSALTPEEHALRNEQYEQLYQLVRRLTPLQQQLIRMRYGNDLRLVVIADILEKPQGTVRKLLARTLLRLREMYEKTERNNG
jgi:RNA polymerase sigma factor (sigma-70 family)